jgi:hypothetical protein
MALKVQEIEEDCEDCGNQNTEKQINVLLIERSKKTEKEFNQYIR